MKEQELELRLQKVEGKLAELQGGGTTYIGVVMDKSSSMSGREDATISGFNEYVSDLRQRASSAAAKPGALLKYKLTLTQFDTEYKTLYECEPLDEIRKLTRKDYKPSGCTALFDAIGRTVDSIEKQLGSADTALILVMTDGDENSSRKYTTKEQIAEVISGKEETGKWTFVYLGADQDAFAAGTRLGFSGGNTYGYRNTNSGIRGTYSNLAASTHSHAVGGGVTTDSFVTDHMPEPDDGKPWIPDPEDLGLGGDDD